MEIITYCDFLISNYKLYHEKTGEEEEDHHLTSTTSQNNKKKSKFETTFHNFSIFSSCLLQRSLIGFLDLRDEMVEMR